MMTYNDIKKYASSNDPIPDGVEAVDATHIILLKALTYAFRSKKIGKEQATWARENLKELCEMFACGEPKKEEKPSFDHDTELYISQKQDGILKGILCNANPWALLCQAANVISVATGDEMMFFANTVNEYAYEIAGKTYMDGSAIENARDIVKKRIELLEDMVSKEDNPRRKALLGNAINVNNGEIERLQREEDERNARSSSAEELFGLGNV